MTIFRNCLYSHKEVTSLAIDTNNGNFLWIAFKQDASGNCRIKKVSANDPKQTYFDVDLAVDEVKKMIVMGTALLVSVKHDTNYIYVYSVSNPISTPLGISRPVGINEAPVDVVEGDGFLWWLFPGTESGEIAKIVKTSSYGSFQETIDLQQSGDEIKNAASLSYKDGGLWIAAYTDSVELWRVYQDSGGIWTLQKNEII